MAGEYIYLVSDRYKMRIYSAFVRKYEAIDLANKMTEEGYNVRIERCKAGEPFKVL